MPSHLNILLHKNFLHPASQPNTCSEPRFSRTTEPNNSTEQSSIQKSCEQCTLGAGSIGCLLPAFNYNVSLVNTSRRGAFKFLHCSPIYQYFSVLKLVAKPINLLLEDQRSKGSCKRNIKAVLLLIQRGTY